MHSAMHPSWATGAQHIQFISDMGNVVAASWNFWRDLLGIKSFACSPWRRNMCTGMWRLCVIYYEFCSKEIRPETSNILEVLT